MQQDHTLELANLVTGTQANRTSGEMLMKTILELLSQVATLFAKLTTAKSENARLKKPGHRSALANHGHQTSSKPNPSDQNLIQDQNVYSNSGQKIDPNNYCSPHGYKLEQSHTPTNCCFSGNGHSKFATQLFIKEGRYGTRSGETVGLPREQGRDYIKI